MQLKENINLMDFLNYIDNCKGDVFFQTSDGDNLNLKSRLSRYVLAIVENNKDFLLSGTVSCTEESDYHVLEDYLMVSE